MQAICAYPRVMKALLLLAGQSKRFWPLKEKTLFPVLGKTLLEHQVERLQKGGVKEIILVGGAHNLDAAKKVFPKMKLVEQKDLTLGMKGALLSALPHVGKGPVMIVSGNDVIDPEGYKALLKEAAKKGVDGAILAQKVETYFPGGYLTLRGNRITGIVEKPGAGQEPSDLVNIVAHVHNDSVALLDMLEKTESQWDDAYEVAVHRLLLEKTYHAVRYIGNWQAVKYPWHLLRLQGMLLDGLNKPKIDKTAKIHKQATIDGPVIIEAGVKVLPHATVKGPAYIGKNAVIGTGALVRGSSVGERCVIGFHSEIKSSVLASDVWTHMTYVGDSVIGRNVSFGGGCITGNFRLDEGEISSQVGDAMMSTGLTKMGVVVGDNCRFGIQVGMNPGVKVGEGTFVAGGAYLTEDIPAGSFARVKEGKIVVTENRVQSPSAEGRGDLMKALKK